MVGWAFSLAMAGNFPALVMGVCGGSEHHATGAIAGMLPGFGLCLVLPGHNSILPRRRL